MALSSFLVKKRKCEEEPPPPDNVPQEKTTKVDSPIKTTESNHDLPKDLSHQDEKRYMPPRDFKFPQREFNGKLRSCSFAFLENYEFLEYSVSSDSVFCKYCRHMSKLDSAWSNQGYSDWKHFTASVQIHQKTKNHKVHKEAYEAYMSTKLVIAGTVQDQVCDPETLYAKRLSADDEHFNLVITCLLFLARQDIAIRGHREDEQSTNKGNMLELHKLLLNQDDRLRKAYENSEFKMLSPKVQNRVLEAAANAGITIVQSELNKHERYSILADSTKDRHSEEIEAIFIRYCHEGQIVERLVGLIDISSDQSAAGTAQAILKVLEVLKLNPALCMGMSFDGAPVMSGHKGGVQAILKKTFQNAVFVHCFSHRLNLVLQKISTNCKEASDCLSICNMLYVYLSRPKHAGLLRSVQEKTR